MTPEEIQSIAEQAAEKAVVKAFLRFGISSSEPSAILAMQKDFAYVRAWRESIELVKRGSIITAVSIIVTGVMGMFVAKLTGKF